MLIAKGVLIAISNFYLSFDGGIIADFVEKSFALTVLVLLFMGKQLTTNKKKG